MAQVFPVTNEALVSLGWDRCSQAIRDAHVQHWAEVAAGYGFTSRLRAAHFWAQITYECSGGLEIRENMNYSAGRILAVFGVGVHSAAVTPAEAKILQHNPVALANRVYGVGNPKKAHELGNLGPNDGWLYRGAGDLNSTGRLAITQLGEKIGYDLGSNPDLVNDPYVSLLLGAQDYVDSGCLRLADADDIKAETKAINGGYNGLADREALLERWKAYFSGVSGVVIEPVQAVSPYSSTPVANIPQTPATKIPNAIVPALAASGAIVAPIASHSHWAALAIAGAILIGGCIVFALAHKQRTQS